ncbi:hypothetical protein BW13_11540 [Bifidobacterium sp. UTCIF-37]|nr:hypothetical protein BW13_11540 [Bifidobacterium sp. UTCIF-37]
MAEVVQVGMAKATRPDGAIESVCGGAAERLASRVGNSLIPFPTPLVRTVAAKRTAEPFAGDIRADRRADMTRA